MAGRMRIKLAHERQVIKLRMAKTQHRIRIAESRDKVKEIDAKLAGLNTRKRVNEVDPA